MIFIIVFSCVLPVLFALTIFVIVKKIIRYLKWYRNIYENIEKYKVLHDSFILQEIAFEVSINEAGGRGIGLGLVEKNILKMRKYRNLLNSVYQAKMLATKSKTDVAVTEV